MGSRPRLPRSAGMARLSPTVAGLERERAGGLAARSRCRFARHALGHRRGFSFGGRWPAPVFAPRLASRTNHTQPSGGHATKPCAALRLSAATQPVIRRRHQRPAAPCLRPRRAKCAHPDHRRARNRQNHHGGETLAHLASRQCGALAHPVGRTHRQGCCALDASHDPSTRQPQPTRGGLFAHQRADPAQVAVRTPRRAASPRGRRHRGG